MELEMRIEEAQFCEIPKATVWHGSAVSTGTHHLFARRHLHCSLRPPGLERRRNLTKVVLVCCNTRESTPLLNDVNLSNDPNLSNHLNLSSLSIPSPVVRAAAV